VTAESRVTEKDRVDLEAQAALAPSPQAARDGETHSGSSSPVGRTDPEAPPGFWPQVRRAHLAPLARPIGFFLLSRIAVLFAALVSKWIFPRLSIPATLGGSWDGGWYLHIAQYGYPDRLVNQGTGSSWAFLPAFPWVIRGAVTVTGLSYSHAAILVTFVLGAASAVAVWLAVREIFGPAIADRSVLFFVFFPTAFVLSMTYTEGLFLSAAGFCLYALSRRFWITASIFAIVASLTRNFGVVLIACVVVAAIPVIVKEHKARPVVALVLSPLGLIGWMAYSWDRVGTPLAFVKAESYWGGAHFIWFLAPFRSLRHLFGGAQAFKVAPDVLAVAALVFVIVGLVWLAQAQMRGVGIPLFWWVFTVGSALGTLSPYWPSSILRYSMAIFPLFAAYAWKIRPAWTGGVVGALAVSQGALAVMIFVAVVHPQATLLAP
jgi:hypothetical protein